MSFLFLQEWWNDRPRMHWREMMIALAIAVFSAWVFQEIFPVDHPEFYVLVAVTCLCFVRAFEKHER